MSDETEAETADSLAEALSTNAKLFGEPEKGKPVAVVKTPTLKAAGAPETAGPIGSADPIPLRREQHECESGELRRFAGEARREGRRREEDLKDGLKQLGDLVSGINYNVASISSLEEGQVLEIQFIDMMDQAYSN